MKNNGMDSLRDVIVCGKVVVVRVDLNLPIAADGTISDVFRLKAIERTVQYLRSEGAKIVLISHFGRPRGFDEKYSLLKLVETLQIFFATKVHFVKTIDEDSIKQGIERMNFGEILLLENLRFYDEEKKNDAFFAETIGSFANVYVNEAFSCSHRKHASLCAITQFARSVAGFNLLCEIQSIEGIFGSKKFKIGAILGGSKISTKLNLIANLSARCEFIFLGGAMANTVMKEMGFRVGSSLVEDGFADMIRNIFAETKKNGCEIILPTDFIVKDSHGAIVTRSVSHILDDDTIFDIGPSTVKLIVSKLPTVQNIIMNGPVGMYEEKPFDEGTKHVINAVAMLTRDGRLTSVAGGGDIVSCISDTRSLDDFTFVSSGGGAFLEYIEGKEMPAIQALIDAKKNWVGSSF